MLPRIQAATLLIWGGRDSLMSQSGRNALLKYIVHVQARIFPSLGHDLFWEDPKAVAASIIDFLHQP